MLNSRFGYSVKKNSLKGLDIDCIWYSNIIWITYYSYSYSGTILNPNIIRIRIRPNIFARILFVFVFSHSEKRILFVFVFGQNSDVEYYSYSYSVKILMPNIIRIRIRSKKQYSLTSATYVRTPKCLNSYLQLKLGDGWMSLLTRERWQLAEEAIWGM